MHTHREKEKIVKTWELVADAIFGYTGLRAFVADVVTSSADPNAKVSATLPDNLVAVLVQVDAYRTPESTEVMRSWLLELMVGLRRRGEELVDHLEDLVVEGCGEMAEHNGLKKFCESLVAKMDDKGMIGRLKDRTDSKGKAAAGDDASLSPSPGSRHPALFS